MAKDDPSIPSWQKAFSENRSDESVQPEANKRISIPDQPEDMPSIELKEVDEMPPVPTREQAAKFLEHPGTQDATAEDKIRFLELKGVQQVDIEALVPEAKKYYDAEKAQETAQIAKEAQQIPQATSQRDIPPIITYPEFLVKRQKPPPLVTTSFLLNTLYGTAGAVAGIYALSKYLLNPMHEELTASRHDFFTHSSSKLTAFNDKLSNMISAPPKKIARQETHPDVDIHLTDSEDDDDPTELFHRDIGVQTSPSLSRKPSAASLADSHISSADTLSAQISRLASISDNIRELTKSRATSAGKEKDTADQLDSFSAYLNELMYSSPYYNYKNNLPSWNLVGSTPPNDEIDRFRQEIRSMKGVMLSARNFPRGGS